MYPTDSEPEQPEQAWTTAPLARMLEDDSASGVVSEGPTLQVPAEMERIQFTSLCCLESADCLVLEGHWETYKCSSRPRYSQRKPYVCRRRQIS